MRGCLLHLVMACCSLLWCECFVPPSTQMWDKWNLPENGRADVPMNIDGDECAVVGMAIDLSSVESVRKSEFR